MPYSDVSQIPEYVKKYSDKIQRQWFQVFNNVYNKVLKETGSTKDAEKRAMMASNSILKKRFTQKKSMEKNTRDDYFLHLVDSWLGNLRG